MASQAATLIFSDGQNRGRPMGFHIRLVYGESSDVRAYNFNETIITSYSTKYGNTSVSLGIVLYMK